jgi:hypothetical protein
VQLESDRRAESRRSVPNRSALEPDRLFYGLRGKERCAAVEEGGKRRDDRSRATVLGHVSTDAHGIGQPGGMNKATTSRRREKGQKWCRWRDSSCSTEQDWHGDAVRAAYASGDEAWRLTAVFCMRFVRGFDEQILEALDSTNPDIHYEAVLAAGNWAVDAAWPHVAALVTSGRTDKHLMPAAIDAVASIRPREARDILSDFTDSDDEDVVEAVYEALAIAEGLAAGDDDEEDDDP